MKHILTAFLCSVSVLVYAQDKPAVSDSQSVFTLGEVVVKGSKPADINSYIGAAQIRQFAKNDVSKALNLLPGVNLSAVGPRNEAMVYVRGYDLRQVPLLIDGIPVYIPYDGYVDLARFTTFDLAEVNVSKGYTSVIYGPNALGGAINLISRKPVKRFELSGAGGWLSGGYRTNINVGSNLGKFYIQAGASKLNRDSFPLSQKFTPYKTEEGGSRNNSWSSDEKYNIKVAYTPGGNSEYALSYIYQHGKKGTPVYAGTDTLNSQFRNPRFWQWPYWNKQSVYFLSNTTLDSNSYIKSRFYYDKFKNLLNSYNDATYTLISRPYAFKSYYNDYSAGGIIEYGNTISARDKLTATIQYKQDVHRENNEGEPVRTMSDNTFTAGIENEFRLHTHLLLLTGFSYNYRRSITAQQYNSATKQVSDYPFNSNNAFNVQGGLEYKPDAVNSFTVSIARKTRFATSKDRYSYRLGTAIPNPDLKAEYALNYELGYRRSVSNTLNMQAALFYSKLNDAILMVPNVTFDSSLRVRQSQLQNVGKAEYLGAEIGAEYQLIASLKAGMNYTFIQRNNLTHPGLYFTDVPRHKVFGHLQYRQKDRLQIQVNTEYNTERYSTTYGTIAGSFLLLNANASVQVWKFFSVEAGINNITDKNYVLAEGYPEAGRNYFINLAYRL